MKLVIFILVLTALEPEALAQRTIYVSQAATGAGDGTSWADAIVHLQDGLAVAQTGDDVWVAEGVYRPDQGAGFSLGDRDASFAPSAGIRLFGSFPERRRQPTRAWVRETSPY